MSNQIEMAYHYDSKSRGTVYHTNISDLDIAKLCDKDMMINMIRTKITDQVANHVMKKLGPAIDKAIGEVLK